MIGNDRKRLVLHLDHVHDCVTRRHELSCERSTYRLPIGVEVGDARRLIAKGDEISDPAR
ncbi:MAG: hypothetical protein EOP21_08190 [Hyphomicrobiales bacterium]|nr:MAG: hypothetical protein EOP21_08190 [Hyphomicrobiales bacterium]